MEKQKGTEEGKKDRSFMCEDPSVTVTVKGLNRITLVQ
jgi:hypothetical protein